MACTMMTPVLEELKKNYGQQLAVNFIDIKEDSTAMGRYGIEMIPTQIFFDATGKELFRHVGFIHTDAIVAKWKELGVALVKKEK